MNIKILKVEIDTDPLVRGYSGMTPAQIVTSMNSVDRTTNKSSMLGSEILNSIDKKEFNALSNANKQLIWDIIHVGTINPFGIEADLFTDTFGGGSNTIVALSIARKSGVSRGQELGIGKVREGHVQEAKA